MLTSLKGTCTICEAESDGYHFGAESCRACAAFFRRSVSNGKHYACQADGRCEVTTDVRCMCRACRYDKCMKVGMNPAGVQQPRDTLGKRSTSLEVESSSEELNLDAMPIFQRMHHNYAKMKKDREVIHRREDESLFEPKVPRSLTYKESALVVEKDMSIVIDWISCSFDEFANLPSEQKRILFRNFLMNFTLLESAYRCHINKRDDIITLASGDYIDLRNLLNFYRDDDSKSSHTISSEEAVKLFHQSFEVFRKAVIIPMMQENIDIYEFFALCTCALWDFGLDGQSDECIEIGRNVKENVIKEVMFYLSNVRKVEDSAIRVAMLLTLLPALNRSVKNFQEDIEISNVFNIYAVPDQFYKIINAVYCRRSVQRALENIQMRPTLREMQKSLMKMSKTYNDSDDDLPTSIKSIKGTCTICDAEGDGYHFGAESCRACAAFFRRSVSMSKRYFCRADGKCEITADVRCMCRACRYDKCMQVGMNPAGVQQPRDTLGKRSPLTAESASSPSMSEEVSSIDPSSNNLDKMPIFERMRQNYTKMDQGREVIHRREGESLFEPRVPRNLTYKESALVVEKEMGMVIDWISISFDEFEGLPCEQKRILFRNFLMNFTLLQNAYLCHINNRDDVIIVASGDYIDLSNLQNFYRDDNPGSSQTVSSEEAVKLFQQSFEIFRKALIMPMMQEKIDIYEFFALCTCALWDFGLDGQSDECIEIGRNVKEKVFKELIFYLRNVRKIEEPGIRIAMLVTILPALNRSVKKFQEDIEISNVFNIYALPDQFYNIINGKFL